MIGLLKIYWLTLHISLLSFGGIYSSWALLDQETVRQQCAGPVSQNVVICRDDFNTVFILSKIIPGPHVDTASILGFQLAGLPGMLSFLLGLLTPGFLLVPLVFHFYRKYHLNHAIRSFFKGAGIASIALLIVFLLSTLSGLLTGGTGRIATVGLLFAVCFAGSHRYRLNPMVVVLGGGVFGYIFL